MAGAWPCGSLRSSDWLMEMRPDRHTRQPLRVCHRTQTRTLFSWIAVLNPKSDRSSCVTKKNLFSIFKNLSLRGEKIHLLEVTQSTGHRMDNIYTMEGQLSFRFINVGHWFANTTMGEAQTSFLRSVYAWLCNFSDRLPITEGAHFLAENSLKRGLRA